MAGVDPSTQPGNAGELRQTTRRVPGGRGPAHGRAPPLFTRFSTAAGSAGPTGLLRGFAVKFYTAGSFVAAAECCTQYSEQSIGNGGHFS